jgi:hypothetical protein
MLAMDMRTAGKESCILKTRERPGHNSATGFPVRSYHLSGLLDWTAVKGELLRHNQHFHQKSCRFECQGDGCSIAPSPEFSRIRYLSTAASKPISIPIQKQEGPMKSAHGGHLLS